VAAGVWRLSSLCLLRRILHDHAAPRNHPVAIMSLRVGFIGAGMMAEALAGRGLHSFTFQLNLSRV